MAMIAEATSKENSGCILYIDDGSVSSSGKFATKLLVLFNSALNSARSGINVSLSSRISVSGPLTTMSGLLLIASSPKFTTSVPTVLSTSSVRAQHTSLLTAELQCPDTNDSEIPSNLSKTLALRSWKIRSYMWLKSEVGTALLREPAVTGWGISVVGLTKLGAPWHWFSCRSTEQYWHWALHVSAS